MWLQTCLSVKCGALRIWTWVMQLGWAHNHRPPTIHNSPQTLPLMTLSMGCATDSSLSFWFTFRWLKGVSFSIKIFMTVYTAGGVQWIRWYLCWIDWWMNRGREIKKCMGCDMRKHSPLSLKRKTITDGGIETPNTIVFIAHIVKCTVVCLALLSNVSFVQCWAWASCVVCTEEELRKLREETNVETLKQELERERCRRLELEQKMNDVLKARWAQSSNCTWSSVSVRPSSIRMQWIITSSNAHLILITSLAGKRNNITMFHSQLLHS